jgi:soluble lytic murein transglycosylase
MIRARGERWAAAPRRLLVCVLALLLGAATLVHSSPLLEGPKPAPNLEEVLARPGRALKAAVDALARGETLLADTLLAAIAVRHAEVADYCDLLRLRLRVDAGHHEDAVELQGKFRHDRSPLRAEFHQLLGRSYAALGQEVRARGTWEYAALSTSSSDQLVALQHAIAESYRRSGEPRKAAAMLLEAWRRHPTAERAGAVAEGLLEIERELGRSLRTASDYRRHADALYRARHNEEALAAFDQALALGLRGKERARAQESRAETLFRLRRYTEAVKAFGDLAPSEGSRIQRARSLARSGRVPDGIAALEELGNSSRTHQGTRALLLAALLRDGEDDPAGARKLFRRVVKRSPTSSAGRSARWRLGWSAFRESDLDEAILHFDGLAQSESDAVSALRPRYWGIRARERRGEEVRERYLEMAREFPLAYYGWRAGQRAGVDASARSRGPVSEGKTRLRDRDLARPRILLEAGLMEEARSELSRLSKRARGLRDRLALAELYANSGEYHRPQRLMVDAYQEQLARGPALEDLELWWHAWPAPFEDELKGARLAGIETPRELVYAVMREESGYRPKVLSVSGARGLLQLMPDTAERVARQTRLESFVVDDLFLPRVNIRLGSAYLGTLLERFDGRASAAIGSYNAGPHAVARWIDRRSEVDDDLWVEEIPYDQTRGYVKRVLRSVYAYQVLY